MKGEMDLPIAIETENGAMLGDLSIPAGAQGIVILAFPHGIGRRSPAALAEARHFNRKGLVTLALDLLTEKEQQQDRIDSSYRFDIAYLAQRIKYATEWVLCSESAAALKIGCYGVREAAAAALFAASEYAGFIEAVAARSGTPQMALEALARVRASVLLIAGEEDPEILRLNRQAMDLLGSKDKRLEVVEGAGHSFKECGVLEKAFELAGDWFHAKLTGPVSANKKG